MKLETFDISFCISFVFDKVISMIIFVCSFIFIQKSQEVYFMFLKFGSKRIVLDLQMTEWPTVFWFIVWETKSFNFMNIQNDRIHILRLQWQPFTLCKWGNAKFYSPNDSVCEQLLDLLYLYYIIPQHRFWHDMF